MWLTSHAPVRLIVTLVPARRRAIKLDYAKDWLELDGLPRAVLRCRDPWIGVDEDAYGHVPE